MQAPVAEYIGNITKVECGGPVEVEVTHPGEVHHDGTELKGNEQYRM